MKVNRWTFKGSNPNIFLFTSCLKVDHSLQNVVVVVVLLFYVHGKHLWSCRDGQITYPGQAVNQYFVHILSPVTDNCPS